MGKLKIALIEIPTNLPEWVYSDDGNVYLDISEEVSLTKTKSSSSLTEFNSLTGDAVLGFALENTDKNGLILSQILEPSRFVFRENYFVKVRAFEGSISLKQNLLEIIKCSNSFECELSNSSTHWKNLLENRTINECEYPVIELSETYLNSHWANSHILNPQSEGFFWSLWHLGNWQYQLAEYTDGETDDGSEEEEGILTTRGKAGVEDLVPVFHTKLLLEKLFCLEGWTFNCPALENEWGKTLGSMVSLSLSDELPRGKFGFKAVVTEDYFNETNNSNPSWWENTSLLQAIDINNEGYDDGSYNGSQGYYHIENTAPNYYADGLSGKYKFVAQVTINNIEFQETGIYFLVVNIGDFPNIRTYYSPEYLIDKTEFTINFEFIDEQISPDEKIRIRVDENPFVTTSNGFFYVKAGSFIEAIPLEVELSENMILPMSSIIRPDTGLEFIKGFAHILGPARIATDWISKTVTFYNPHRLNVYGHSEQNGFYKNPENAIDITNLIVCKSKDIFPLKNFDYNKYIVGFKDTSDDFLKNNGFSKSVKPYAREIIINENSSTSKVKYFNNEYYEPTGNIYADDIVADNSLPVQLPVMWDNDENKISKKRTPRIVSIIGYVQQYGTFDGAVQFRGYRWKETEKTFVPFVSQLTYQGIGSGNEIPFHNVVFLNERYNIWQFWEKHFYDVYFGMGVNFKAIIDYCFFEKNDFRDYYRVSYGGRNYVLKLEQISNFKDSSSSPSELKFISPYSGNLCNNSVQSSTSVRCDYYMDFSQNISAVTLGNMTITNFIVNGQNVLNNNVDLITPVTLSGSYVTNLVDTLNSIGVPNYIFGYAGMNDKMFSIQHPINDSFEIIIENKNTGQDMYRWTNDGHYQGSFFGMVTWTLFAYNASPNPTNCILLES